MKVFTNIAQHFPDFIRLNEMWITEYFEIEERDRELARNPHGVIDNGGYIFTGVLEQKVIATSALFVKNGEYELARMAVDPRFRGLGYGRKMAEHAIDVACQIDCERLRLHTHSSLKPAVSLYESLGFAVVHRGADAGYRRSDLIMEKRLFKQAASI